jgi:hypothetical protein
MAEGASLKNQKELRTGSVLMQDAVAAWPEFNLFTSGYTMSAGPVDEAPFKEGLEQRLSRVETLKGAFETAARGEPELTPMFNAAFSCMGCHQAQERSAARP